jgi:hypothetical protein
LFLGKGYLLVAGLFKCSDLEREVGGYVLLRGLKRVPESVHGFAGIGIFE